MHEAGSATRIRIMSTKKRPSWHTMIQGGMIDSHFHTAMMEKKGLDSRKLLGEAMEQGLAGGIDIGVQAGDCGARAWLLEFAPQIRLAAGLAPAEAEHEDLSPRLELLEADIEKYSVDAVGEIGVDAYWNYGSPQRQKELFAAEIDIATLHGLPVIIHNREADEALLDVLSSHKPACGGIMHCFSSSYETAKRCIDYGLLISFAGNLSFKKSDELRRAARRLPVESLLVETDSPFLSPEPVRGKPNHPGRVAFVYHYLAELRGIDTASLIDHVRSNYDGLFSS